jgi:trans-AT polyketide synthase/acyltransferase/oxidoreductase domain-containing protein
MLLENDRLQQPMASMLQRPAHGVIGPEALGSAAFRSAYGLKYAYCAGAMYKGIASKELVVAMGRAGLMGFLGTGGMKLEEVESAIRHIQSELSQAQAYGMNLLANLEEPDLEDRTVDLFLQYGVHNVEAAAFMQMTPSLIRYRLKGLTRRPDGSVHAANRVVGKVSRPEVAEVFMRPAPRAAVAKLLAAGRITTEEAELSAQVPMASDICVEADSGGHTDQGVALVLMPAMRALRDTIQRELGYAEPVRLGAAGGIGAPEAAAAAFVMGADFIVTGSINQCTVEAGTSDVVKELLQTINVQDTDYAPAGDMFEMGARVQVLRKGVLFAVRANKLYELYQRHNSLDEIDEKTRAQIEEKYFKRSFDAVWAETRAFYALRAPAKLAAVEKSPKQKMALVFRWYFVHATRLAMQGSEEQKVDYQVQCGPALGAFNQWVKGTALESWRERRVASLGEMIMQGAAQVLTERFATFRQNGPDMA